MPDDSPSSNRFAVRLAGVERTFDTGMTALRRFDLDVPAGQFLAVLGPSGSGKSTLLRIIAGLDRATAGRVEISTTSAAAVAGTPASTSGGVAFVFQDAHLLPWRSVRRNVALPLELAGVAKRERLDRATQALATVGLNDAASLFPAQLSGGMKMRVSLARALVTQPKLLLLDEPFAALDEITRQQLDDELRAIWQRTGATVIFVTHSIMEAAYLAERAIVVSRRPARIVLDRRIELPATRTADIRGSAAFARELGELQSALRRGFDLPDEIGSAR